MNYLISIATTQLNRQFTVPNAFRASSTRLISVELSRVGFGLVQWRRCEQTSCYDVSQPGEHGRESFLTEGRQEVKEIVGYDQRRNHL